MKPLLDALHDLGALSQTDGGLGFPPVTILGGGIRGGKTVMRDIESSQYVSSLLIAAPFAAGEVTLVLEGKIPSLPYVALTIETMGEFGVRVIEEGPGRYVVPGGQRYRAREYRIEGDVSSASYFFAAALLKGRIRVENVNPQTRQGDIGFLDILERLGSRVQRGDGRISRYGGRDDLGGDDLRHGRHAGHGADAGGAFGHAARQDIYPECRSSAPEGERPPGRPVERAGKDWDRGERACGRLGHHRGKPARFPDPNLQRSPDRHGLRRPGTGRPGDADFRRGVCRKVLPGFWEALEGLYRSDRVPSAGGAIRLNTTSPPADNRVGALGKGLHDMNIIFTGYRCTGKTSAGKRLAQLLGRAFYDADDLIIKLTGRSVEQIVAEKGWPAFREVERAVILELSGKDNCVIAPGGGAVLDQRNVEALKKNGLFVWLVADTATIVRRLKKDQAGGAPRPLALGEAGRAGGVGDPYPTGADLPAHRRSDHRHLHPDGGGGRQGHRQKIEKRRYRPYASFLTGRSARREGGADHAGPAGTDLPVHRRSDRRDFRPVG